MPPDSARWTAGVSRCRGSQWISVRFPGDDKDHDQVVVMARVTVGLSLMTEVLAVMMEPLVIQSFDHLRVGARSAMLAAGTAE